MTKSSEYTQPQVQSTVTDGGQRTEKAVLSSPLPAGLVPSREVVATLQVIPGRVVARPIQDIGGAAEVQTDPASPGLRGRERRESLGIQNEDVGSDHSVELFDDTKFFNPTPESRGHMQFVHDMLPIVQAEIPYVKGNAFFGSRIVGKERGLPKKPSDLDTIVFYDGSGFEPLPSFPYFDEAGVPIPDIGERIQEYQEDKRAKAQRKDELFRKIKSTYKTLMQERGLPVDIDERTGENKTIFPIDISQKATEEALRIFSLYVDANFDSNTGHVKPDGINGVTFRLVSRFLPAVGEDVYKNRREILDSFSMADNGELLLRGLIDCLKGIRREDVPESQDLPQTINEARVYFLTDVNEQTELEPLEVLARTENETFVSERFQGGEAFIVAFGENVLDLYNKTFPQIITDAERAFAGLDDIEAEAEDPEYTVSINEFIQNEIADDTEVLKDALKNPNAHIIILRDKENQKPVGFTCYLPKKNEPATVLVGHTAILKEFRDLKGWSVMMDNVDDAIAEDDGFTTMVRTVRKGIAGMIPKRYEEAIVHERELFDHRVGRQREFTIDLAKLREKSVESVGRSEISQAVPLESLPLSYFNDLPTTPEIVRDGLVAYQEFEEKFGGRYNIDYHVGQYKRLLLGIEPEKFSRTIGYDRIADQTLQNQVKEFLEQKGIIFIPVAADDPTMVSLINLKAAQRVIQNAPDVTTDDKEQQVPTFPQELKNAELIVIENWLRDHKEEWTILGTGVLRETRYGLLSGFPYESAVTFSLLQSPMLLGTERELQLDELERTGDGFLANSDADVAWRKKLVALENVTLDEMPRLTDPKEPTGRSDDSAGGGGFQDYKVADMVFDSIESFEELNASSLEEADEKFKAALIAALERKTVNKEAFGSGTRYLVNELEGYEDVVVKRLRGSIVNFPPDGMAIDVYWAELQRQHSKVEKYFGRELVPIADFVEVNTNFDDPTPEELEVPQGHEYIKVQKKYDGRTVTLSDLSDPEFNIPPEYAPTKDQLITFINRYETMMRQEGEVLDNQFTVTFPQGEIKLLDTVDLVSFKKCINGARDLLAAMHIDPQSIQTPEDAADVLINNIPVFSSFKQTGYAGIGQAVEYHFSQWHEAGGYLFRKYPDVTPKGFTYLATTVEYFPPTGEHNTFIRKLMAKFGITEEDLIAA